MVETIIIANAPVQTYQTKLMKKESDLLFDIDIKFSSSSDYHIRFY